MLNDLLRDLRYAARLVRRQPLFALTVAMSLAIGLAGTTTVFTLIQALLLRTPAGVSAPDRLVEFAAVTGDASRIPYPDYIELRRRMTTVDGLYGYLPALAPASMRTGEGSERVFAAIVTPSYFGVLGVQAAAGRLFHASDGEHEAQSPFVVISHRLWTRRFQADTSVVGQTIRLNGHPLTIVGVSEPQFHGTTLLTPDLWVPFSMAQAVSPGRYSLTNRASTPQLIVGARLRPGVVPRRAAAELAAITRQIDQEVTPGDPGFESSGGEFAASPIAAVPAEIRAFAAGGLSFMMALLATVLLIACANVTGVLLARAVARRREIAVRLAVGAARRRLVRQLLTETLVLFALGGAAGLVLARAMIAGIGTILPALPQPIDLSLPLDSGAVLFAAATCLGATVVSGLAPALRASRADVVTALKQEEQGSADRLRLRSVFVVAQVTFSIVLVVIAALFVRALQRTSAIDRGFDPRNVDAVTLDLSGYSPQQGIAFARTLATRVRALPDVGAASVAERPPDGSVMYNGLLRPADARAGESPFLPATWEVIDSQYFATLGIRLVAGRVFEDGDGVGSEPVAIVSESTAKRLWPDEAPIGKYLAAPSDNPDATAATEQRLRVVGVARDLGYLVAPDRAPAYVVYVPLAQRFRPTLTLLARRGQGQSIPYEIRALIVAMDPEVAVGDMRPLVERDPTRAAPLRFTVGLTAGVGVLGLLLAAIGVYGVTAQAVAQRTREIAVRIALGAGRSTVMMLVLRRGMTLIGIGSLVGLLVAAAAGRALSATLFGLTSMDPVAFAVAAVIFVVTGLVACLVPVYSATRISAMDALRTE